MAAAFAPVRSLGWGLVVAQPANEAFAAARRIQLHTLFWVGLCSIVAVFGGVLFARGVSRPIAELAAGARRIGQGDFDQRFSVRSNDEIGQLSGAFNTMTLALKQSFETIQAQYEEIRSKNAEIQSFNEELRERVEQRTWELKQAQEQIVRSQKLAAVAELGAGVAHEVNNPLTGVLGFVQIMLEKSKPGDEFHDMLQMVRAETLRIQMVISELQRFSTPHEKTTHVAVDLNELLDMALNFVQAQLKACNIEVRRHFSPAPIKVSGDPTHLEQAVLHIINNAVKAMPAGGVLDLTTEEVENGASKLIIADTGRGISEENLPKIFEPFFTTKDDWSGRGLGLSVAHRIVEEHNGQILVASAPDQGTAFTLIFPSLRPQLHLR